MPANWYIVLIRTIQRSSGSIIDTGVSPIETTSDGTTILDVLICQNQTPCCFREDFLEGVTDITMDLIEYGAAISEHAMWCDSGLLSSLRIFEKVGKRNCGREGMKQYHYASNT
jgi:hypothetical protein